MNADEIQKALQDPFPAADIEWRVGSTNREKTQGLALAYVTNRAIQRRLDEVVGCFGWRNEYRDWKGKGVLCGLSLKFDGEWITKWDGADETDFEPTKGGLSDSMKRAAYQWGIGRYLYALDSEWVEIEQRGNTHFIKRGCYPVLPAWALPAGEKPPPGPPPPSTKPGPQAPTGPRSVGAPAGQSPSRPISDAQAKRLFAILVGDGKRAPEELKLYLAANHNYHSTPQAKASAQIQGGAEYDGIVKWAGTPGSDEPIGEKVAEWLDAAILAANLTDQQYASITEEAGTAPFANTAEWSWKEAGRVYAAIEKARQTVGATA